MKKKARMARDAKHKSAQKFQRKLKASVLIPGKLYWFIRETSRSYGQYIYPDGKLLQVLGTIQYGQPVMFVEMYDGYAGLNAFAKCKMVKIVSGDVTGYLVCYYKGEKFPSHKWLTRVAV